MLKSGFSSQSGGRVAGRFDDCCARFADGLGTDGEDEALDLGCTLDFDVFPDKSLRSEEPSENVDAHLCLHVCAETSVLVCHPILTAI